MMISLVLLSMLTYSISTGLYGSGQNNGHNMYMSNDGDIWSIMDSQRIRVPELDTSNYAMDGKIRILKRQDTDNTFTTMNGGEQVFAYLQFC